MKKNFFNSEVKKNGPSLDSNQKVSLLSHMRMYITRDL